MHIAFLTFEYITESTFDGGLANYLYRTAIALSQRGHRIEIFTESDIDGILEHEGIVVHQIKLPESVVRWIRRVIRYSISHDAVKILPVALKFRSRVLECHRKNPFDVIQAVNLQSLGLGLAFFSKIPLVVRVSSYQPYWRQYDRLTSYEFSRSTKLIDWFERLMVRRARAVYAPSNLIASAFRQHVRNDVQVIYPPFMLNHVSPDSSVYQENLTGVRYLLYFGTIKVLKGGMVLGDALRILLPRFPDLHVVLVGKDTIIKNDPVQPPRSVLQYIKTQAGINASRVLHFEKLRHEQLYPIIHSAVGVVLPSRIDNFPNTCLESMALGKVVIGTRGASFDELIEDGHSGILVPIDNPVALAEAMGRVWQMDDNEKTRMGANAMKKIALLNPELACLALEKFYEQNLEKM